MLNNVPTPTQTLGQTNAPILSNFTTIDTGFSVDHITFGAAGVGFHKQVTFPDVTASVPSFLAGQMGLFNENAVPTSRNDIWMARGTSTPFPITGYSNGTIASNTAVAWSYLPSGMKIIGGTNTTPAALGGFVDIVFGTTASGGLNNFPGFSSFVMFIGAQRIDPDMSGNGIGFMAVRSYTLTGCTIANMNKSGSANNFFWCAIGI